MTSPNLQFAPQWLKKPTTANSSASGSPLLPSHPSPPLSAFAQNNGHGGNAGPGPGGRASPGLVNGGGAGSGAGIAGSYPFPNGSHAGGNSSHPTGHINSHSNGPHLSAGASHALIDGYGNPSFNGNHSAPTQSTSQDSHHPRSTHLSSHTKPSNPQPSRPFRYTKTEMLALFDPDKVQHRPLELVDLAEVVGAAGGAGVILGEKAQVPMGMIDWTEEERKLFLNPVRRQPVPHSGPNTLDPSQNLPSNGIGSIGGGGNSTPRGLTHRSGLSSISGLPVSSPGVIGNSTGGRGFGRGEGGAFGFGIGGGGGAVGGALPPRGTPGGEEQSRDRERERKAFGAGIEVAAAGASAEYKGSPAGGWIAGQGVQNGGGMAETGKGYRGTVGGAFDGVAKGVKDSPRSSNTASTWRPAAMRNAPSTSSASGIDQGVFGFASPSGKNASIAGPEEADMSYGWRERERARQESLNRAIAASPVQPAATPTGTDRPQLGAGGGPGWGKGGRWRMAAAEREKEMDTPRSPEQEVRRPILATPHPTESMAVVPPATPVQERDLQVENVISLARTPTAEVDSPARAQQSSTTARSPVRSIVEVVAVKWFYTDPAGLQQGPFGATEMQDWYSHGFFQDNLPLKREHETIYQTLAMLKGTTGSAERPFLTAPKAELPPSGPPTPPPSSLQQERSRLVAGEANTPQESNARSPLQNVLEKLQLGTPSQSDSAQAAPPPPPSHTDTQYPVSVDYAHAQSPVPFDAFGHQSPSLMQNGVRAPWDNGVLEHRPAPIMPLNAWGIAPSQMGPGSSLAYNESPPRSIFEAGHPQQMPMMPRTASGFGPGNPLGGSPWVNTQSHIAPPYPQQPGFPPMPIYAPMPPRPFPQAPMHIGMQPWQQPPLMAMPIFSEPIHQDGFAVDEPAAASVPAATSNDAVTGQVLSPQRAPAEVLIDAVKIASPVAAETSAPSASVHGIQLEEVSSQAQAPAADLAAEALSAPVAAKPVKATKSGIEDAAPTAATPSSAVANRATKTKGRTVSAATKEEKKEQAKEAAALASASRPSTPSKGAAWAAKEEIGPKASSGPSLRDIQEAEAKVAEAKKVADIKARAISAAASSTSAASSEFDLPQTASWGLSATKAAGAIAATQPTPAPVWGASETTPRKTLKHIQEEEQKRAAAAAQAKAAASPAAASAARGYAALAAGTAASNALAAGWSTIGAGGKAVTPTAAVAVKAKVTPSAPVVKPAAVTLKPAVKVMTLDEAPPSIEFIRWTKQALAGLKNVNMDEFIQMLLTFPVEPGQSARADVLEIISDSVYANSSTLDGKRFAQDFYSKRKADAQARITANASGKVPPKSTSLADIVKTQPKATNDFGGFKVVKPKGKGKK